MHIMIKMMNAHIKFRYILLFTIINIMIIIFIYIIIYTHLHLH